MLLFKAKTFKKHTKFSIFLKFVYIYSLVPQKKL